MALGALVMAACSTVGAKAENQKLVGRWRSTDELHVAEYTFLANGTFSGFVASEGSMLSQFTGQWLLRDGAIRYKYTGDKLGRIAPGTRDRDKLVSISQGYFVIESADGRVRKYVRIDRG